MLPEILIDSEQYPSQLSSIQNPPKILYVKDNLDLLKLSTLLQSLAQEMLPIGAYVQQKRLQLT